MSLWREWGYAAEHPQPSAQHYLSPPIVQPFVPLDWKNLHRQGPAGYF